MLLATSHMWNVKLCVTSDIPSIFGVLGAQTYLLQAAPLDHKLPAPLDHKPGIVKEQMISRSRASLPVAVLSSMLCSSCKILLYTNLNRVLATVSGCQALFNKNACLVCFSSGLKGAGFAR